MSLIMGILDKDFGIICADTQLNEEDGSKNIVQKVYALNPNIIFSVGGEASIIFSILDNVIAAGTELLFHEFVEKIHTEFSTVINSDKQSPNFAIITIGKEGNCLKLALLAYLDGNFTCEVWDYKDVPIRRLLGQTELHLNAIRSEFSQKFLSEEEIVAKFQNVLNAGVQVDTSINNKMQYLILRR